MNHIRCIRTHKFILPLIALIYTNNTLVKMSAISGKYTRLICPFLYALICLIWFKKIFCVLLLCSICLI